MSDRQTRASSNISHLSVQQVGLGGRGRGSRSRTPSPNPAGGAIFFPPSVAHLQQEDTEVFADAENGDQRSNMAIPADATADEIRQIAEQALQETRSMRANQDRMTVAVEQATAAAAAATAALQALSLGMGGQAAAPAQATPMQTHRRKRPELPAFDKNNIHIWVQRIEAAYAREEISDPKQKFAFLESVIGVNMGPTINGYMFGAATSETWNSFIDHLLDTFGPTKEQRCSTFLDGVSRDGRRPSDLLALIRDKGKDVTIDDLEKHLVLRALPPDVRKLLQDKIEDLNATETANLADSHFDKEGRPLNSTSGINNVGTGIPSTPEQHSLNAPTENMQEEPNSINAINNRQGRGPPRGGSNNRSNRHTPAFQSASSPSGGADRNSRSNSRPRPQQQRPSNPPAGNSNNQQEEFSTCRIHSRDANSRVCAGPKCPSHVNATSCLNPSCRTHAKGGNGRGGRR